MRPSHGPALFRLFGSVLLLAVAMLGAAPAPSCAQTLRFGGSSGGVATVQQLMAAFRQADPGAVPALIPDLSSGGGIRAVVAGKLDIAISSRPLKAAERDAAADIEIGRTPFVLIASRDSPAAGLSLAELEAFYAGTRTTWADGRRLRLVLSPSDDVDNELLSGLSASMRRAVASAHARPGMLTEPTDRSQADAIERLDGALGTSTLALVRTEGRPLKVLALNGVAPSPQTLEDGTYPLAKSFYLVWSRQASPLAERFVRFARSPAGRAVLRRAGYLPSQP